MKANPTGKVRKRRKWSRGKTASSPEAGLFRDCGAPLMPGEDLLSGFKRATATNPEKLMAKCASRKAVRSVQQSLRCNQAEAVMTIYSHLRSWETDPFDNWNPERSGLISYLRTGSERAAMKIAERQERSPWGLTVSLDAPPTDSGEWGEVFSLGELVPDTNTEKPDAAASKAEMLEILNQEFASLDEMEQQIISSHFGLGGEKSLSLLDTRKKLGLSRSVNDKLFARAISKLRKALAA